MYEGGSGRPSANPRDLEEPDFSRLGSRAVGGCCMSGHAKSAVLEEKGVRPGVGHSVEAPWLDIQLLSVPSRSKKDRDRPRRGSHMRRGVDLWFDERMTQVPFISDRLSTGPFRTQDCGCR